MPPGDRGTAGLHWLVSEHVVGCVPLLHMSRGEVWVGCQAWSMAPAEVVLTWCQSPQEWTCQGDEVPGSLPQGALVHSAPWVLEEAVEKAPSPLSEHLLHPSSSLTSTSFESIPRSFTLLTCTQHIQPLFSAPLALICIEGDRLSYPRLYNYT